jgi:hypothetical protein
MVEESGGKWGIMHFLECVRNAGSSNQPSSQTLKPSLIPYKIHIVKPIYIHNMDKIISIFDIENVIKPVQNCGKL